MHDVDPKLIEQYKDEMLRLQRRSTPLPAGAAAERPSEAPAARQPAGAAAAQQPAETAAERPSETAAERPTETAAGAARPSETPAADEPEGPTLEDNGGTGRPAAEPERGQAAIPAEDSATAYFQAQVFAGQRALPIRDATVILKRGETLLAFLLTDESGQTQVITTQAPPRENTLDPENPNKTLDYLADVSAAGFAPLRNLLVRQVGGTLSLLHINLVPSPEEVAQ